VDGEDGPSVSISVMENVAIALSMRGQDQDDEGTWGIWK